MALLSLALHNDNGIPTYRQITLMFDVDAPMLKNVTTILV
jgi:hypothetical protein